MDEQTSKMSNPTKKKGREHTNFKFHVLVISTLRKVCGTYGVNFATEYLRGIFSVSLLCSLCTGTT